MKLMSYRKSLEPNLREMEYETAVVPVYSVYCMREIVSLQCVCIVITGRCEYHKCCKIGETLQNKIEWKKQQEWLYHIYLVKCCGVYYLSSKNRCDDYSSLTTTHCSQTMLGLLGCDYYSKYAFNQVNTVPQISHAVYLPVNTILTVCALPGNHLLATRLMTYKICCYPKDASMADCYPKN